ncbi:hypothetical protein [Steroidobacter cummioxidans]|uniref:hypothetical protein n=1 Tax=Steroidobacter cummioxidans TaxID=1803913 RepID=UPI000E30FD81|nr:hypothetical protein [Steroidobacter cummioxidans]
MRTALTLAAAVVINVTALAAMGWDVNQAQRAPGGEVSITQIEEPTQVAAVAPAKVDGQVVRTASSL